MLGAAVHENAAAKNAGAKSAGVVISCDHAWYVLCVWLKPCKVDGWEDASLLPVVRNTFLAPHLLLYLGKGPETMPMDHGALGGIMTIALSLDVCACMCQSQFAVAMRDATGRPGSSLADGQNISFKPKTCSDREACASITVALVPKKPLTDFAERRWMVHTLCCPTNGLDLEFRHMS